MDTLWPLVVSGGLGIFGTLLGTWLTQRSANKRETAALKRELEREQDRWRREDEARTFEHRRVAYVEFYEALHSLQEMVSDYGAGAASGEVIADFDTDWRYGGWKKLQHLEVYATPGVAAIAAKAYELTAQWGDETRFGRRDATYQSRAKLAIETKATLLKVIRTDLGIPDTSDKIIGPIKINGTGVIPELP